MIFIIVLCLAAAVLLSSPADAFTIGSRSSLLQTLPSHQSCYPSSPIFATSVPFADTAEPVAQIDVNGNKLTPGSIVAISTSLKAIKAYQVPRAAFGSFDPDTKQFVPQDGNNATHETNCLILPNGLRGQVTKVYDVNEFDRTHPIVVKFVAGETLLGEAEEGEGYAVPNTFIMHFDASEVVAC